MRQNNTTVERNIIELNEFFEYVDKGDCINIIGKIFFKYVADTGNEEFTNLLTKKQVSAIHELLNFIQNHINSVATENSISYFLTHDNIINCRTGLNELFFHSLKRIWGKEYSLEWDEIRIIKDLFELLNSIEEIHNSEKTPPE